MIESGEKREEYREIKPYWSKRLVGFDAPLLSHRYGYQHANVKGYTHVRFRYGYTKRTMLYKIDEIIIGRGNPYWGAPTDKDVFIIKFHKKEGYDDGYCNGYDEGYKDAIEKAVEWLEKNLLPAMVRSDCYMFNGKFIEDFKIAMEGGEK